MRRVPGATRSGARSCTVDGMGARVHLWARPPWTWVAPPCIDRFLAADSRVCVGERSPSGRRAHRCSLRPNERRGWIWPCTTSLRARRCSPGSRRRRWRAQQWRTSARGCRSGTRRRRFGRHRWDARAWKEPGGFVVCLAVGARALPGRRSRSESVPRGDARRGVAAAVDDNWTMPLASAVVLALLA